MKVEKLFLSEVLTSDKGCRFVCFRNLLFLTADSHDREPYAIPDFIRLC